MTMDAKSMSSAERAAVVEHAVKAGAIKASARSTWVNLFAREPERVHRILTTPIADGGLVPPGGEAAAQAAAASLDRVKRLIPSADRSLGEA